MDTIQEPDGQPECSLLSAHNVLPRERLFSTWTFSTLTRCTLLSTNDPVTLLPEYAGLTQNLDTKPWWTQAKSHHQPWARQACQIQLSAPPFWTGYLHEFACKRKRMKKFQTKA